MTLATFCKLSPVTLMFELENPPSSGDLVDWVYALLKYAKMKQDKQEILQSVSTAVEKLQFCVEKDPGVLCVLIPYMAVKKHRYLRAT